MSKKKEKTSIIGTVYGYWTVMGEFTQNNTPYFQCRCKCGIERAVAAISLRNGHSTNCGCVKKIKDANSLLPDAKKTSPEIAQLFALISEGFLPPADQMDFNGSPAWSIESVAKLLGTDRRQLIRLIRSQGAKFVSAQRHNAEPV